MSWTLLEQLRRLNLLEAEHRPAAAAEAEAALPPAERVRQRLRATRQRTRRGHVSERSRRRHGVESRAIAPPRAESRKCLGGV